MNNRVINMSNLRARKKKSRVNKMLVTRKKMLEKCGVQNYSRDTNNGNTSNILAL